MKLRIVSFLLFCLSIQNSHSQDSSNTSFFLGGKAGAMVHSGLADFNTALETSGTKPLNTYSIPVTATYYSTIGRFSLGLDATLINYLGNGASSPESSIELYQYFFHLNLGWDLLGKYDQSRLDLYTGLGSSFGSIEINQRDTLTSFNQIIEGAQNTYNDMSTVSFLFTPGLRFTQLLGQKRPRFALHCSLEYHLSASPMRWSVPDFPPIRQGGLHFSLGWSIRIPGFK